MGDADDVAGAFHRLVGGISQQMLVVTAAAGEEIAGCLVGFSTQCSIEPPRYLVMLSDKNRTYRVARRAPALGVHLLTVDHLELAEIFGGETGDAVDKFADWPSRTGPAGVPLLGGVDAWFVGRILSRHRMGDHVGHLLAPIAVQGSAPRQPLTLHEVHHLRPGHRA